MFEMRNGCLPTKDVLRRLSSVGISLGVCASLLVLGGCASRQAKYRVTPQYKIASEDVRVAGYRRAERRVEIEDDGIEAQSAPRYRRAQGPDDPSEPFSPNYGTRAVATDPTYDEDEARSIAADDAYDPFLDGPQWQREPGIDPAFEGDEVVGSVSGEREQRS